MKNPSYKFSKELTLDYMDYWYTKIVRLREVIDQINNSATDKQDLIDYYREEIAIYLACYQKSIRQYEKSLGGNNND
jgi:hypothetical protein